MNEKEIVIDRDIPMPSKTPGTPSKYPWRMMKVGDSFVYGEVNQKKAASNARGNGLRHGMTFATRVVEENGKKVVRVWRTA